MIDFLGNPSGGVVEIQLSRVSPQRDQQGASELRSEGSRRQNGRRQVGPRRSAPVAPAGPRPLAGPTVRGRASVAAGPGPRRRALAVVLAAVGGPASAAPRRLLQDARSQRGHRDGQHLCGEWSPTRGVRRPASGGGRTLTFASSSVLRFETKAEIRSGSVLDATSPTTAAP